MKKKNEMGALLPIKNSNGQQTVDARKLYKFLQSKQQFADWIKNRIDEYGFTENEDYVVYEFDYQGNLLNSSLHKFMKTDSQTHTKEYEVTIDMAKELAMVERNEQGRAARKYFIDADKKVREMTLPIGGVYPIVYEGKIGYPRRELLKVAGYSPSSGTVSRLKKMYDNHFFHVCRVACVSADFAKLRFEQGKVRQLEINFRETGKLNPKGGA